MERRTTLELHDLRPGDLLFFIRPSLLQWGCDLVGDPYRGVAIVDVVGGEPVMLLCGHDGVEHRPLVPVLGRYDAIDVVLAPTCDCTAAMLDRARGRLGDGTHYPIGLLPVIGAVAAARQLRPGAGSAVARAVVAPVALSLVAGARALRRRPVDICSTFVASCLEETCTRHQVPLTPTRPKRAVRDPAAGSRGGRLGRIVETSARRCTTTPSDLWRALPADRQATLRLPSSPATVAPPEPPIRPAAGHEEEAA